MATWYRTAQGYLVYGTWSNERINGSNLKDVIYGNGGHDTLRGYNGNDSLWGGAGNDWLYGGNGSDTLVGESGRNYLYGEGGNDLLYGGGEAEYFSGGTGNDTVWANGGNDKVYGGSLGIKTLYGGNGADKFVIDYNDFYFTSIIADYQAGVDVIQSAEKFNLNKSYMDGSDAFLSFGQGTYSGTVRVKNIAGQSVTINGIRYTT